MIRAIFFDMGGTLDGDGLHWLDRFVALYADAGVAVPREILRDAFDEAERLAALDDAIATLALDEMIDRHVGWQLTHLRARAGADLPADLATLQRRLVDGFLMPPNRPVASLMTFALAVSFVLVRLLVERSTTAAAFDERS